MLKNSAFVAVMASALVLGGGVAQLGAQQGGGGNAAVRAAIEAGNKKFSEGVVKKDAAMIASAYTDDAVAYPANSEAVIGKAAIQAMWKTVLDSGIAEIALTTTEVESSGDLAYEVGTYAMKTADGKPADHGKYVVIWKRTKGQWLLHRDIWTTSMPAK
jgi:uncharacterized protein (TIGR02246 family)